MSHLDDVQLLAKLDELWEIALRDPHGPYTRTKRVWRTMTNTAGSSSGGYIIGQAARLVNIRYGAIAATTGLGAGIFHAVMKGYEEFSTPTPELEEHQLEWDHEDWATHSALLEYYRNEAYTRPGIDPSHPALQPPPDDVLGGVINAGLVGSALGHGFYTRLPRYNDEISRHRRYHDANIIAQYSGVLLEDALEHVYDRAERYMNPSGDPRRGYDDDADADDDMAEYAPAPPDVPVVERRSGIYVPPERAAEIWPEQAGNG